jgi:precorrin-6x reductase
MADLLCETQAETAVDATHPYAIDAHNEIRKACETARVPLIRLKRLASDGADRAAETPCLEVPDMEAAAGFLAGTNGNILLAIGAKELDAFADKQGLTERVFARVLPMPSSIEKCASIGLPPSRIIAMQGPFSLEMNVATFRQYRIEWLATKASGDAGGEREKLEAARRCGVGAVLVRRPDEGEDGLTLEETLARLFKEAGLCASR